MGLVRTATVVKITFFYRRPKCFSRVDSLVFSSTLFWRSLCGKKKTREYHIILNIVRNTTKVVGDWVISEVLAGWCGAALREAMQVANEQNYRQIL